MKNHLLALAITMAWLLTASSVATAKVDSEVPSEKCARAITLAVEGIYRANMLGNDNLSPVTVIGEKIFRKSNRKIYAVSTHNNSDNPYLDIREEYRVKIADSGNGSCSIESVKVIPNL